MSRDQIDSLSLAELMAIEAGAIENLLPNGEYKSDPEKLDWASL